MEKEAVDVFYKELRRKLREIDWLNTPYLQMMMDDNDQWLIYQKELESISMKIEKKELVPPKIEKGNLIFNWPKMPIDDESSCKRISKFSERN